MKVRLKTVLSNGIVQLDVKPHRYDVSVDIGNHILMTDYKGNYYIDGIPAKFQVVIDDKRMVHFKCIEDLKKEVG